MGLVFDTLRSNDRCFSGVRNIQPRPIGARGGLDDCSVCSFSCRGASEKWWGGRCQPRYGRSECGRGAGIRGIRVHYMEYWLLVGGGWYKSFVVLNTLQHYSV